MGKKKIETFEDLRVWQQGIELVKQIYLITKEGEINRDFGLRDQLRRAAVSIPTNVAEGFERYSRKEYVNFLSVRVPLRLTPTRGRTAILLKVLQEKYVAF